MDHLLTPWEKIAIIFVGGSIAGLTLLVVVCLVCPTCFFYRILNKSKYVINCFKCVLFSFTSQGRQKVKKSRSSHSFGSQLLNHALIFILSKFGRGSRGPTVGQIPQKCKETLNLM